MQIMPILTEPAGSSLAAHTVARHPLAAAARRENLTSDHLAVAEGPPALPLLLFRAEMLPGQPPGATMLDLRAALLADARALPGQRHAFRGLVTLRLDTLRGGLQHAGIGSLEWRAGKEGSWARVPLSPGQDGIRRYEGKAAQVATAIDAWLRSAAAAPVIGAALRSGAAMLARSAARFEADAEMHEATPPAGADALPRRHALAWAAQQRETAGRQRQRALLLERLAGTLPAARDAEQEAQLLAAAAAAAREHAGARRPREAASPDRARPAPRAKGRKPPTQRHDAATAARLRATAPALLAALESVLEAASRRPGRELPAALSEARRVIAEARGAALDH